MKKFMLIILILLLFGIFSCKKTENTEDSRPIYMDELVITDYFEWKTIKTLDVNIILPSNEHIKKIQIVSADGKRAYFNGYPEDNSHIINTVVTIPTYEEILQLKYGNYEPIVLDVSNQDHIYFNYDLFKETLTCGPCDGKMTSLTLRYDGSIANATIKVIQKDQNQIVFDTIVQPGEDFTFYGTGNNGIFGNWVKVYINDVLDVEIHTSCSQPIEVGMTFGNFYLLAGISRNGGPLCDNTGDCGPCDGKMTSLTLRYDGSTAATIKVVQHHHSEIVFEDIVQAGAEFTFSGTDNHGTFGSKVNLYINTVWNVEIHTSCSQPIEVGMTFGDFYLVAGTSRHGGPLCDTTGGGDNFKGSVAFEDLWPGTGDYDINDLVLNYDFNIQKNTNEQIENITATFTIRAFGASFHNGFGFTFPNVDPTSIISVTGYDIAPTSIFTLSQNGTESGQSVATIIVFDDTYRIMPHPGSGIGVNTEKSEPFVTPDTIVVEIVFMENGIPGPGGAVTYSQLDIGNFNPFIIVNQNRGIEVHLPDYPPTDLVDLSYFNTFNDDSNPATGRYYKTINNYPWALNFPDNFDYPIEKQDIVGAYLKFTDWAQSSGTIYTDWYQDKPGYRVPSLIY